MPLATKASRPSNESTSEVADEPGAAVAEVLEDEPLEGHAVGQALEGEGLDDQLDGRTSWKQPWKPYSLPSLAWT